MLLEFQDESLQQGLAALSDVQLHASPGTAYEYANANYMLLGMVVEAVRQEQYAAYVHHHILEWIRTTRIVLRRQQGPQ